MRGGLKNLRLDYPIIIVMLLLIMVGLICLYSVSVGSEKPLMKTSFGRQVIWICFGFVVFIVSLLFSLNTFYWGSYAFYVVSLILLTVVLFCTTGPVHRWIELGTFHFQPSEFAKIAALLLLSRYLSQKKEGVLRWRELIVIFGFVLLPVFLILLEPDVGTASVFVVLLIIMIIWTGIQLKMMLLMVIPLVAFVSGFHRVTFIGFMVVLTLGLIVTKYRWWTVLTMGGVCSLFGLLAPGIWSKLEPYQQQRILIFLRMKSDPHGAAYQIIQSRVAIGSGGILGKGFLQGSQTQLRFLPEQHTDFIFSVLGEEFGFVGVMIVLGLFLFLFIRLLRVAKTARNRIDSFIVVGGVSILVFQLFVNVGMSVGLVPVTGLPIPFLSYGGSSLFMSLALLGLACNVSRQRHRYSV